MISELQCSSNSSLSFLLSESLFNHFIFNDHSLFLLINSYATFFLPDQYSEHSPTHSFILSLLSERKVVMSEISFMTEASLIRQTSHFSLSKRRDLSDHRSQSISIILTIAEIVHYLFVVSLSLSTDKS